MEDGDIYHDARTKRQLFIVRPTLKEVLGYLQELEDMQINNKGRYIYIVRAIEDKNEACAIKNKEYLLIKARDSVEAAEKGRLFYSLRWSIEPNKIDSTNCDADVLRYLEDAIEDDRVMFPDENPYYALKADSA